MLLSRKNLIGQEISLLWNKAMLRQITKYVSCPRTPLVRSYGILTANEARTITDQINRDNEHAWQKEKNILFGTIKIIAKDGRHSCIIRQQDFYVTLGFLSAEMEKLGYSVERRIDEIEVSW